MSTPDQPTPAIPEGFTPHDGGPCPYAGYDEVDVVLPSGEIWESYYAKTFSAGHDWWQHQSPFRENDIIAHRRAVQS